MSDVPNVVESPVSTTHGWYIILWATGLRMEVVVAVVKRSSEGFDAALSRVRPDRIPSLYSRAVGDKLEAERVRADISAAELAGRINIPVHWVLDVEEGRVPLTVELVGIWCEELLRVPASPLLARAASQVPPGFHGLQIDIRLAAEMRPTEENYWSNGMVKWARGLLTEGSLPLVTVLNHDILRFSEEWGIESEFLITILHDFVPLRGKYIPVTEGQCT